MDGDGSTAAASDANQDPAVTAGTGGAADGAGAAAPPAADAFAAERERLTAQARDFQSQKDKLAAENDALKARLAEVTGTPVPPAQNALTPEGVLDLLKRDRAMTEAAAQLKSDFPLADPSILSAYDSFESPEALRVAVEASHARITALAEKAAQPLVDQALAPYVEKYGRLGNAPVEGGATPPPGTLPTAAEVANYTLAQLDALAKEHGEDVLERIWRSAQST